MTGSAEPPTATQLLQTRMARTKPRGRPPADGNFIAWTEPLVEALLHLRYDKYAAPMAAARGTRSLRQAWTDLVAELTQPNDGRSVTAEQCRNKLKALRNKYFAYHAGMATAPAGLALMDIYWEDELGTSESSRQKRPNSEQRKNAKRPRLTSTGATEEEKTGGVHLVSIAPASTPSAVPVSMTTSTSSGVLSGSTAAKAPSSPVSISILTASATPTIAASVSSPATAFRDMSIQTVLSKLSDIRSVAAEAARVKENSSQTAGNTSNLEKLINDRFAEVLERQDRQLRLAEEQNELLMQLVATLNRDGQEHYN